MVISIQDDLYEIKNQLKASGYTIYNISDNKVSDAFIYSESSIGLINVVNSAFPSEGGSLFINADSKSIHDILFTLRNRTYSNLF